MTVHVVGEVEIIENKDPGGASCPAPPLERTTADDLSKHNYNKNRGPLKWWKFPCREQYDKANGTLTGMAEEERKRADTDRFGTSPEAADTVDAPIRADTQLNVIPEGGTQGVAGC